jgi:hypothetical protein
MEGDSIGVYKAYIKDANGLKDLVLLSLFSESNEFNLRPIPSFLFIFIVVEELLIAYIYIFIYKSCMYAVNNITILSISLL